MSDVIKNLRFYCAGHPFAKIPWPHRVLHDAIDEIERLEEQNKMLCDALESIVDRAKFVEMIAKSALYQTQESKDG